MALSEIAAKGGLAVVSVALFVVAVLSAGLSVFLAVCTIGIFKYDSLNTGFAQLGVAVVLGALSFALFYFGILFAKYLLGRGGNKRINVMWNGLAANAAVFIIGCIVFAGSFGTMDFTPDYSEKTYGYIVAKTETFQTEDALSLLADDIDLKIHRGDGENFVLEYHEDESFPKPYSLDGGMLELKKNELADKLSVMWRRGIFSFMADDYIAQATLTVPNSYEGEITLKLNNATVSVTGANFKKLDAEIKNGSIEMYGCELDELSCNVDNGKLQLSDSRILGNSSLKLSNGRMSVLGTYSNSVDADINNGELELHSVNSPELKLNANNGMITGSLSGKSQDYSVKSNVSNGSSNLSDREGGDRSLEANVQNGSIDLSFAEKEKNENEDPANYNKRSQRESSSAEERTAK